MIIRSITGSVFAALAPAQAMQHKGDPVAYMRDLYAIQLEPSYSKALVQRIGEVAEKGRDFVKEVVEASTWYNPNLGSNIDTWA